MAVGTYSSFRVSSSSQASKVIFLLTLLPIALAAFSFVLQWRGSITDPSSRWKGGSEGFPGMVSRLDGATPSLTSLKSDTDCSRRSGSGSFSRFPYLDRLASGFSSDQGPKIFVTTSTSAGLDQILPWLFYHKVIGVTNFFLFVEGIAAASDVSAVLEAIPEVSVIYRTKELEEEQAKSHLWNEAWFSSFLHKPCNYELFVKQTLNMEMAVAMARNAGADWIIHLDTDELVHPAGASEYSLRQVLGDVPANVDIVIFPNYESCVESDNIKEPFVEVSMFKKNYDHLMKDTYFGMYKEAARGNPDYFLAYGNGKAAARIKDGLRPSGTHRWLNYKKLPNEVKLEEAAILHYAYTKLSDFTSGRDNCHCKPTKEDAKRCYLLEFDRAAFIMASTTTQEKLLHWYREHVVWTDDALKMKLLKNGLLTRIHGPMVIIQGLVQSGIFSSLVEPTKHSISKKTFLSSIAHQSNLEARNLTVRDPILLQFQMNRGLHQDASRKTLAAIDASAVVPQLSPPHACAVF